MKRAHNTRTLENKKMANCKKFLTILIVAYVISMLIIIPLSKALGNIYMNYDKCLQMNKATSIFISDASY